VRANVAVGLATLACSAESGLGSLTIGVDGHALGNYIQSLHVVTTVDGATTTDTVLRASRGPVFPHEVKLDARGHAQAKVGVRVEGFASDDPREARPAIIRTAETTMAPWNKLLRIDLDTLCVLVPPPGGLVGPTCAAPETCTSGRCTSDLVNPDSLAAYTPNWVDAAPDTCRPTNAGAPKVIVGNGQNDYFALRDGQMLQAQAGPQGGHHIWIAVRMQNLKQSSSTTTVTATQPGTGVKVWPYSVVFTFLPGEGGFCRLYGLRFQLDANGVEFTQFLGKPLDVKVEIRDVLGEVGVGTAHVNIDRNVLPL
jgi:hypothetical protein